MRTRMQSLYNRNMDSVCTDHQKANGKHKTTGERAEGKTENMLMDVEQ